MSQKTESCLGNVQTTVSGAPGCADDFACECTLTECQMTESCLGNVQTTVSGAPGCADDFGDHKVSLHANARSQSILGDQIVF